MTCFYDISTPPHHIQCLKITVISHSMQDIHLPPHRHTHIYICRILMINAMFTISRHGIPHNADTHYIIIIHTTIPTRIIITNNYHNYHAVEILFQDIFYTALLLPFSISCRQLPGIMGKVVSCIVYFSMLEYNISGCKAKFTRCPTP